MKRSLKNRGDDGFVLVDTLTAVMVISLVLTVCLMTVRIASASARRVATAAEARALLLTLMATTPRQTGVYLGVSGNLTYQVNVTDDVLNDVHLCRLNATVTPKSKGRVYRLSGTRWCKAQPY